MIAAIASKAGALESRSWEAMSTLEGLDSSEVPGVETADCEYLMQQLQMANLRPLRKFCKTVLEAALPGPQ